MNLLKSLLNISRKKKHKTYCVECEKEKQNKYCEYCKKETNNLFKITIKETIKVRESMGIEQRREGIKKYIRKIFQGYEPSINSKKYPDGVEKYQNVDRENDWYDKVVKDNRTGKTIRDVHEPLSQHISSFNKKQSSLIFKLKKYLKSSKKV